DPLIRLLRPRVPEGERRKGIQIQASPCAPYLRGPAISMVAIRRRQHPRGSLEGHASMKINKLLVAAVLAIAIGVPIAAFVEESNVPQTSPGIRVPFLHGFTARANPAELASLERADQWLNSPPLK